MGNHTATHCHCGAARNGSDHCEFCGCEEFEGMCGYDHLHALEQDNTNLREANREWRDEAARLRDERDAAIRERDTQKNLVDIARRHTAHAEADARDWQHRCVQLKQQLTDADRATLANAKLAADRFRDCAAAWRENEQLRSLAKFQGDTADILLRQLEQLKGAANTVIDTVTRSVQ